MGSLLAIIGDLPRSRRESRLAAMAHRSPYRGDLHCTHHCAASLAIQSRTTESSLHEDEHFVVAVHGRAYLPGTPAPHEPEASSARRIATQWTTRGPDCLREIDGEFSLLVHDKLDGAIYACVSISMTRPLFWAQAGDVIILASEIRQVAAGSGMPQRTDIETMVEILCFGTPVLDTERTQYQNIRRLVAPRLYKITPTRPRLNRQGNYWEPPPAIHLQQEQRRSLPERLEHLLSATLAPKQCHCAHSLSGGYDSGTLWILANRDRHRDDRPKGFGLVFPGASHDETKPLLALLRQTGTEAELIDATGSAPSDFVDAHLRNIDRLPAAATLYYMDLVGAAMQQAGATRHVTGAGAEAWLTMQSVYAADLLRQGRLLTLIRDALHYRSYVPDEGNRLARIRRFAKAAIAPPGSRLRRFRAVAAPGWLHPRWHDLYRSCRASLSTLAAKEGHSRGSRWLVLNYFSLSSGIEALEQLCQHYELELDCPYLHRGVAEFGFSVPARALTDGRHAKSLLGRTARLGLGGAQPPWPENTKVVHDDAFAADAALVGELGPARRWQLVDAEVITLDLAEQMTDGIAAGRPIKPFHDKFSYAERYIRFWSA